MKKLTCLFLAVLLTIALAVPAMASEQNVGISLVVEYDRTEEFYNLHTADWRVYVDGSFADSMSLFYFLGVGHASAVISNAATTAMPTVELFIVNGYEILGPILFDLELAEDMWGYYWSSTIRLEEALAAVPDPAPETPDPDPETPTPEPEPDLPIPTTPDFSRNTHTIDGIPFEFLDGIGPEYVDGYLAIPLRSVAEALGYDVDWDGTTRTVTLGNATLTIGRYYITVGGIRHTVAFPHFLQGGRTIVSACSLYSIFGVGVYFCPDLNSLVLIT